MRNLILIIALMLFSTSAYAAKDFPGTSDYLWFSTTSPTNEEISISSWFNSDVSNANQTTFGYGNNGSQGMFRQAIINSGSNDPIRTQKQNDGGTAANADTSTFVSSGTWYNGVSTFTSNTSRAAYLDAGGKGTNSTNVTDPTIDRAAVGTLLRSSNANDFNGRVFMVATWNAALTDAEATILALGFDPMLVRPASLALYSRLIRDDDFDYISGNSYTTAGTVNVGENDTPIFLAY